MYVLNYASKMVIQHNSREEIEMSGTSLPTGPAGNLGRTNEKKVNIKEQNGRKNNKGQN
jgi:hypothetical protein